MRGEERQIVLRKVHSNLCEEGERERSYLARIVSTGVKLLCPDMSLEMCKPEMGGERGVWGF